MGIVLPSMTNDNGWTTVSSNVDKSTLSVSYFKPGPSNNATQFPRTLLLHRPTDLLRVFTRPPVKLFLEGILGDALRLHELSMLI